MREEEISELDIRLAFHYESVVDVLFVKGGKDLQGEIYDTLDVEKLRTPLKFV